MSLIRHTVIFNTLSEQEKLALIDEFERISWCGTDYSPNTNSVEFFLNNSEQLESLVALPSGITVFKYPQ